MSEISLKGSGIFIQQTEKIFALCVVAKINFAPLRFRLCVAAPVELPSPGWTTAKQLSYYFTLIPFPSTA